MIDTTLPLVYASALGLAVGLLLALVYHQWWRVRYSRSIRRDAVRRSQAVTAGMVHEQLVPFLPDFEFNPKDARFLGSPVDFVVFDGLSDGRLERIVFVEVKTGRSRLSERESQVRDVVTRRDVVWSELRAGA